MRIPTITVALLAGGLILTPADCRAQNPDNEQIRARFAEIARLYNSSSQQSAKEIADVWTVDGTHANLSLGIQEGQPRPALAAWANYLKGARRTLTIGVSSITWVTPDVAAVDAVFTLRPTRDGVSNSDAVFAVMRRERDSWRIVSSRAVAIESAPVVQPATQTPIPIQVPVPQSPVASIPVQAPAMTPIPPSNPCAAIQANPLFDFQVSEPARYIDQRGVSPRPVRDPAAVAKNRSDTIIVQFVVDTAGKTVSRSINVLRIRDISQSLKIREVADRWLFRPAVANGCKVSQIVQTAIER